MKSEICNFDEISKCICICVFILSFLVFKLVSNKNPELGEEERKERENEMLKYFEKHKQSNEEFFFGSTA